MFCDSPRKKLNVKIHPKFELIGKASAPPPVNTSVASLKYALRTKTYLYNNHYKYEFNLDTDIPEIRSGKLSLTEKTKNKETEWSYAIIGSDRIILISQTNYNEYMDLRLSTSDNLVGYFVNGDDPQLIIFDAK